MGDKCESFFMSKKLNSVFLEIGKSGYIAGLKIKDGIFCLAAALSCDYFPTGLNVLGIFCWVEDPALGENELVQDVKDNLLWLKVELENPIVLILQKLNNSVIIKAKSFACYDSILKDINMQFFTHNPAILLRAVGRIPFLFETSALPDNLKDNVDGAVEKLLLTIRSQTVAFHLKDSKFILTSLDPSTYTCGNLKLILEESGLSETLKKSTKFVKKQVCANFNILLQVTGDAAIQNTVDHSLVIHSQQKPYRCISMNLPFDVLIVCSEATSLDSVYQLFNTALQRQLRSMSECFMKYIKTTILTTPVPHHFYPDSWEVPFSIVYPLSESDEDLELYRKNLHELLLLPLNRPTLRKSNKWTFDEAVDGKLINPHESIIQSGVVDGELSLVYGRYTYYHYMQDHIDDNGWGCAYRSLQTIISWFRFQGYTERKIPSHQEIQQALVDVGDKPKSFVGSRKWIGSQEVSFCLDQLINIQSKIMCVSSGSEMANKGRELFIHFKEQGTPVMIGGGVLAHTIIGVDFNEKTGDLKFLVLDPHFTGGEDLNTIVNKGWCGWKGINFWDENAFYNLCLPQCPKGI